MLDPRIQRTRWLTKVLRGEVAPSTRRALLLGTIALALVIAWLNVLFPLLRLSVLAFALVITIDALEGVRVGMAGAALIALVFTAAEWFVPGLRPWVVPDFVSRLIAFLIVIGLVEVIRIQNRVLGEHERREHEVALSQLLGRLAESDARFQAVTESIPFGVWHCNPEGRVIYMSPSFLDMLGMTLDEVRAGGWFDRVVSEDAERIRAAWADRDRWGDLWEDEYRIHGGDGKMYTILCRGRDVRSDTGERLGWTGVNFDLTERTKAREQLRFLVDAGRILSLSLDPVAVLERIAHLVVPRMADWCAVELSGEDGRMRTAVVQHADPEKLDIVRELRGYAPEDQDTRAAARVARTGVSELFAEVTDDMLVRGAGAVHSDRYLELLRSIGFRSAMLVPLQAREKILGVMIFVQAESGRAFTADDVGFAEILAARTALSYDNARSYAKEQRVADTFQRASLPTTLPRMPGIRLRATYLSGANESEIGGDWYDAFLLPGGELALSIGDVAGKGLRAAVSMVSARQALRGAALEGVSPAEVLSRVNRRLTYEASGMVTALFGVLDPITMELTFACAGHPPPMLATQDGKVEKIANHGLPLGLFADQGYAEVTTVLPPGSLLVLYTDGLIEFSRNVDEGEKILLRAVAQEVEAQTPNPADAIARRVILGSPNDDVAVLTVSIAATPLETLDLVVAADPSSARVLRQALRRFALGVGLAEHRTTEFLVACGEAISNVIEHAYGIADGPLMVRAYRDEDDVVISISDRGRWRAPRDEGGGRGIPLMKALADSVEVDNTERGTTVRLRMSLLESLNDRPGDVSARRH